MNQTSKNWSCTKHYTSCCDKWLCIFRTSGRSYSWLLHSEKIQLFRQHKCIQTVQMAQITQGWPVKPSSMVLSSSLCIPPGTPKTHTHTYTLTYIQTHIHTHTQTHTYNTLIHVYTYTNTYTHLHSHIQTYTHTHSCIYTYTHIYTHRDTHTHTHIHSHIKTSENMAKYEDLVNQGGGHTGVCYSVYASFSCLKYFIISPKNYIVNPCQYLIPQWFSYT